MRQPQQQNRRGRGRGRKPQNPLQRGYESNGPDVKIRGNASLIAEKYITLARDALSAGDTVMAENYLQHAEHYNRIIATAQQQQDASGQGANLPNGSNGQSNGRNEPRGEGRGETRAEGRSEGQPQRQRRGPAPVKDQKAEESEEQQPAEAVVVAVDAPVSAEPATEEPAPKPRRRRAPRAKMATPAKDDDDGANPGPVRMGDIPMDEAAG